jgi:hypothetical protein
MATDEQMEVLKLELLPTIRERANIVYAKAKRGDLSYMDFDESLMPKVAEYVLETIKVNFLRSAANSMLNSFRKLMGQTSLIPSQYTGAGITLSMMAFLECTISWENGKKRVWTRRNKQDELSI